MMRLIIFAVIVLALTACVQTSTDLLFDAAELCVQIEQDREKAADLERLAAEKEAKENPVIEEETETGTGARKIMCIRHAKNGHADHDGGVAVGEPRDGKGRRFASCSLNGKNIRYHGQDAGAHTFWNMGAPAEGGEVICVDYQGWSHKFKMIKNKNSGPQCN